MRVATVARVLRGVSLLLPAEQRRECSCEFRKQMNRVERRTSENMEIKIEDANRFQKKTDF